MAVTEAAVLDALRPIIDPDFGKDIVELGFVKDVVIDGGRVAFKIELTTPACPVKEEFQKAAEQRVGVADLWSATPIPVERTLGRLRHGRVVALDHGHPMTAARQGQRRAEPGHTPTDDHAVRHGSDGRGPSCQRS